MFFESDTLPFRFMLETCVHFDLWNKYFLNVGYFSFFRKITKKIQKKIIPKIKCTHVSSINLKGKVSDSKNIDTALIYFCSYPCGTPCIMAELIISICILKNSGIRQFFSYRPLKSLLNCTYQFFGFSIGSFKKALCIKSELL